MSAAATQPNTTWRAAENHALRPLKSDVSMPIAASAAALATTLAMTAVAPLAQMNGRIGNTAPNANSANDVPAALQGLPPSSAGSRPSSSRASVSSALLLVAHHVRGDVPRLVLRNAFCLEDQRELVLLGLRRLLDLLRLARELRCGKLARIGDRQPLAERHRARARDQAREPGEQDGVVRRTCTGDTHQQAEIGHEAVVRAEHGRTQVVARSAAMPRLGARDVGTGRDARRARGAPGDCLHDRRVPALLGGDRVRIGLTGVLVAVGELGGRDRRQHERHAEALRDPAEQARAKVGRERGRIDARGDELVAPQIGMFRFRLGQLEE